MPNDEKTLHEATVHPFIYSIGVIFLPIFLSGLLILAATWLYLRTTRMLVTDRRIVLRKNFFGRNERAMQLSKIESVDVSQDPIGKLLGCGRITISGSGGASIVLGNVSRVTDLEMALQRAVDSTREGTVTKA